MKASLLSLVPSTLLTVLIAATAALRFYDATDFPPKIPPVTPRDWSFWLFTATLLVALVDFGFKWFAGNLEAAAKIESKQRQDRQNFALYSYIANPTDTNRERLEAICQEIEQTDLDN